MDKNEMNEKLAEASKKEEEASLELITILYEKHGLSYDDVKEILSKVRLMVNGRSEWTKTLWTDGKY